MQRRPHFILADAGLHDRAHFLNRRLTGGDGALHSSEFIIIFQRPCMFGQHLARYDINTVLGQRPKARNFDFINRQSPVAAGMLL